MKFEVKRPRPTTLSDPYFDFTPEILRQLLAKPERELNWADYQAFFGPHLPAGTYEEVIYFLPAAFDYLLAHTDESLDLVTPLVGFVSKNVAQLDKDGLLEPARQRIRDCLLSWTAEFRVTHSDRTLCAANGFVTPYANYVMLTSTVCEGTTDLVRFETQADLALEFVRELADHGKDFVKAAWFLEYSRSRYDVYTPPDYPPITELIANLDRLREASKIISVSPRFTESPTYWHDTLNILGILPAN